MDRNRTRLVLHVAVMCVGIVLSIGVNYLLSIHGIAMPQSFTYGGMEFSTLYSEINARSLYLPSVTVFLAATLTGVFPALKAAHIEPAVAMRMH